MPFNGSGGVTQPANSIYPATANTLIESAKANASIADLYTMMATAICKDGQTTTTQRIPFAAGISLGSQTITAMADGTATTHGATLGQVRSGASTLIGSVAGTNTITGALTPALTAYASGNKFVFVPAITNTGATTINIDSVGAKSIFSGGVALTGGELVATIPVYIEYDGTQFNLVASGSMAPMVDPAVCDGRLTLTTGTAVTTADVTAAETLYFTPYKGNKVALYTGATWKLYSFAEVSVDIPDANQLSDVFLYDNAGTLTLDVVAWTNDTTRATALTTQNGVLVKTAATSRRYIGTFYGTTAGNGQAEDSLAKRNVYNYYNRVARPMKVVEATNSWTYQTDAWRQANAATANQLEYVQGVSEDAVTAEVLGQGLHSSTSVSAAVGVGVDSATVNSAAVFGGSVSNNVGVSGVQLNARYLGFPGVGRHTLVWLENGKGNGITTTFIGDNGADYVQSGITGEVMA